jgi:hypothetical protein
MPANNVAAAKKNSNAEGQRKKRRPVWQNFLAGGLRPEGPAA